MIPEFAIRLICGLSAMWCLAPRAQITSGFFRIQMLLTMGLGVLLTLTAQQRGMGQLSAWPSSSVWVGVIIAVLSFWGSVLWTLERRGGGTRAACAVFVVAVSELLHLSWTTEALIFPLLRVADQLSAALLIGSVTSAMLLGHWYLTATGMRLDPFIRLNQLFLMAIIFRTVFVCFSQAGPGENAGAAIWVLRWAGLIGPAILAVLTMRILKYRNTQSATGVLYAATILVFMGEMASGLMGRY